MKFHKKYPKAELHQEVEPSIVKFKCFEPCGQCREPTEYRYMGLDVPICSHECLKAKIKEAKHVNHQ